MLYFSVLWMLGGGGNLDKIQKKSSIVSGLRLEDLERASGDGADVRSGIIRLY